MTEQEAMNVLEKYTDDTLSPVVVEAHRMAITALEEIQQYRTIGTVEEITKINDFFNTQTAKILAKLQEYERTGLTPEQIQEIDRLYSEKCRELEEYKRAEIAGMLVRVPCKKRDIVYELCKCDDGIYRIFPMTVKNISIYGSVLWTKGKEATTWNIYAESDCTKMYKKFYDFGETVFLTKEEAEAKLTEMEGGHE